MIHQYAESIHPAGMGGIRRVYRFENGYAASVVNAPFSYGGREGLWELAVMDGNGINCDTPITDKVIGRLSDIELDEVLDRIAALPMAQYPYKK